VNLETMASRDRLTLDIADLRERIESVRGDAAWSEMSLAQKLRVLIRERLEQMEAEKKK
jgi:ribosome-binding protein aMBF1 (putative translation factor)